MTYSVEYADCLNVRTSKEKVLSYDGEYDASEYPDGVSGPRYGFRAAKVIQEKDEKIKLLEIEIEVLKVSLRKITNNMHMTKIPPCPTCKDITKLIGEPFGCVYFEPHSNHPSSQTVEGLSAPENILSIRAKRAIAEAENLKNRMKVLADQMDEYIEKLGKD